jgi:hypothetical protein
MIGTPRLIDAGTLREDGIWAAIRESSVASTSCSASPTFASARLRMTRHLSRD